MNPWPSDDGDGEIAEIPAGRWHWTVVPIGLLGLFGGICEAFKDFADNEIWSLGMHLRYVREREERAQLPSIHIVDE